MLIHWGGTVVGMSPIKDCGCATKPMNQSKLNSHFPILIFQFVTLILNVCRPRLSILSIRTVLDLDLQARDFHWHLSEKSTESKGVPFVIFLIKEALTKAPRCAHWVWSEQLAAQFMQSTVS